MGAIYRAEIMYNSLLLDGPATTEVTYMSETIEDACHSPVRFFRNLQMTFPEVYGEVISLTVQPMSVGPITPYGASTTRIGAKILEYKADTSMFTLERYVDYILMKYHRGDHK